MGSMPKAHNVTHSVPWIYIAHLIRLCILYRKIILKNFDKLDKKAIFRLSVEILVIILPFQIVACVFMIILTFPLLISSLTSFGLNFPKLLWRLLNCERFEEYCYKGE